MADIQAPQAGAQTVIELTRIEEEFLIEAEKEERKRPCFDARALRQMGLAEPEVNLLQVFFMKLRNAQFDIRKLTSSECLQSLVSALRYLPKTGDTGRITVESYKDSDCLFADVLRGAGKWSEAFRHEFGRGLIWSHKERREPALLAVLAKVFDWVEKFQKAHGLYQELPPWLKDGMAGDFRSDSWIGSDLYEGAKTMEAYRAEKPQQADPSENPKSEDSALLPNPGDGAAEEPVISTQPGSEHQDAPATDKQKALLNRLLAEKGGENPGFDVSCLTKREASRHIDELFQRAAATGRGEDAA